MKNIWNILLIIAVLATAVINVYLEFSHWEYTRAKLFIEYWPVFLTEAIVMLILYILTKRKRTW